MDASLGCHDHTLWAPSLTNGRIGLCGTVNSRWIGCVDHGNAEVDDAVAGRGPIELGEFLLLGWRYWRRAKRYLGDGQAWFEVLPATVRKPLHALHITPASRA